VREVREVREENSHTLFNKKEEEEKKRREEKMNTIFHQLVEENRKYCYHCYRLAIS